MELSIYCVICINFHRWFLLTSLKWIITRQENSMVFLQLVLLHVPLNWHLFPLRPPIDALLLFAFWIVGIPLLLFSFWKIVSTEQSCISLWKNLWKNHALISSESVKHLKSQDLLSGKQYHVRLSISIIDEWWVLLKVSVKQWISIAKHWLLL